MNLYTFKNLVLCTLIGFSAGLQAGVVTIGSVDEYSKLVQGQKPVLTMFAASWCGPCKASKPHFIDLANSNSDVVFCLIEAENKRLSALQTGLRGVPTFVGSVNGREIFRVAGGQSRGQLQDMVKKLKAAR